MKETPIEVEFHAYIYGEGGSYRWKICPASENIGLRIIYEEYNSEKEPKGWVEIPNENIIGWKEAAILGDVIRILEFNNEFMMPG